MKNMRNKLDERQEQKLLQIEHNGCWFAFWALIVSLFVQQAIFGIEDWKHVAGEWIIFMCLALYLMIACMKNGIWDRKLEPNASTNFWVSLLSSVVFGAFVTVVNYLNYHSLEGAAACFVVFAVMLFLMIFSVLSISSAIFKRKVRSMEESFEQKEE